MKLIRITSRPAIFLWISVLTLLSQCNTSRNNADEYTCPMHPSVHEDKPAKCPVCGMDLVKRKKHGHTSSSVLPRSEPPPHFTNAASAVRCVSPVSAPVYFQAEGIVSIDKRNSTVLTARYSGRVEKLLVKSDFQRVEKGDLIMAVYSPDLITSQHDFLDALSHDKENKTLRAFLYERLKLLGMSPAQLQELTRSGKVSDKINIYSPMSGYVAPGENIIEGQYIHEGQSLVKIFGDRVYLELQLSPGYVTFVKLHDSLTIMTDGGAKLSARADFILPATDDNGFILITCYLRDKSGLMPGQLVSGGLTTTTTLTIPAEAVIDTGTRLVVFVKERGVFFIRTISATKIPGRRYVITDGLTQTDSIASNAQFFNDSDSFIQTRD